MPGRNFQYQALAFVPVLLATIPSVSDYQPTRGRKFSEALRATSGTVKPVLALLPVPDVDYPNYFKNRMRLSPALMPYYSSIIIPQANASAKLVAIWNDRGLAAQWRTTQSVGAGGGLTTLTDTFAGLPTVDLVNHTLDSGQAWVESAYDTVPGFPRLILDGAGGLVPDVAAVDTRLGLFIVSVVSTENCQVVEIDYTPDTSHQSYMEIRARCANDPLNDPFYEEYCAVGYKTIPGAGASYFTLTGNYDDFGQNTYVDLVNGQTYRIKLEVTDLVVRFYLDGVLQDTSLVYPRMAGGYVGVWFISQGGVVGTEKVENFSAVLGCGQSLPVLVAVWNDRGLSAQVQTTAGSESVAGAHPIPPSPPPPPPAPVVDSPEEEIVTPFGSVF